MGQLHAVCMAMFVLCGGSGRAEDEDLLSVTGTGTAKGFHMLPNGERTQSLAVTERGRREKCPGRWRTTPSPCPTPHLPPHSHPGGTFPRMLTSAAVGLPAVPDCLDKAGLGKHRGWLRDGQ